jgi:hypothetical protein
MTLFQKRAWLELGLFLAASVALAIAVVTSGLGGAAENDSMRIFFEAAIVIIAVVYGIGMWFFRWQLRRGRVLADERDRRIIAHARTTQLVAAVLALLVWTIALTEYYWEAGTVPVGVLSLLFYCVILVVGLSGAIGVLVGYRRDEAYV